MPIKLTNEQSQLREQAHKDASVSLAAAQIQAQGLQDSIKQQQDHDSINKTYQDYYDGIISNYELELQKITGTHIAAPFVEADVTGCANYSGRLYPGNGQYMPANIAELNGGGTTAHDISSEADFVSQENATLAILTTGFSGSDSGSTMTSITSSSNSFDKSYPANVSIGDKLVISASGFGCVVVVSSITDGPSVLPALPTVTTIGFTFFSTTFGVSYIPSGTIPIGATISGTLAAFTNSERTSEVASNPNLQDILTQAILSWKDAITYHSGALSAQLSALAANQDDNLDLSVAPAIQLVVTAFTTYLLTTDVSDTGLSGIAATLTSRATAASTRTSAIPTASSVYYAKRYNYINLRCNTASGSSTLINLYQRGSSTTGNTIANAQNSADAYET